MRVGPSRLRPLWHGRIGARTRKYSSSQITCCMKLAPRPPYSLGQEIPTQPAACIFFCQAMRFSSVPRSGAMRWSAASSTQISGGRLVSSHRRNSLRKAACSGLSAKSMLWFPLLAEDVERQKSADHHVWHVAQLAQFQIYGDAADGVGLLSAPGALDQEI